MTLEQGEKGEGWVEEDFSWVGLKAESADKQILPSLPNPRNSHRSGGPTPQAPTPGQEHSRLSTHRCQGGSSSSRLWTSCHRFLSVAYQQHRHHTGRRHVPGAWTLVDAQRRLRCDPNRPSRPYRSLLSSSGHRPVRSKK